MDYKKWADDYFREAEKIGEIISKLKAKTKTANAEQRQSLNSKICKYREMYCDCIFAANTLFERFEG